MSEQEIYNYLIIASNFLGLPAVFWSWKLRLYVECLVIFRLMIVSALFHACVLYPDACLTLGESVWWYADFMYSFSIISFIFLYVVSLELNERRWAVYLLSETFAMFGAISQPNNTNVIPYVYLSVGFLSLMLRIIYAIYKAELWKIKWRPLILTIIFFGGGWTSDQLGRQYNNFYIGHSIWHCFCFLGLLVVLFARYRNEKERAKLKQGLIVPLLLYKEESLDEITDCRSLCLTKCEIRCGKRTSDLFTAFLLGDNKIMEETDIEYGLPKQKFRKNNIVELA